jgi:hypothetical protein
VNQSRNTLMLIGALLLSGCATTMSGPGPVDVTRFHLGAPIAGDAILVEPLTSYAGVSPEDQLYVDAVSRELARVGFTPGGGAGTLYVAAFSYKHVSRGMVQKRAPISIGIGGGSYSGGRRSGVGVGGGVGIPIGGGRAELIGTELTVQIKRRQDGTILWEGRAVTEGLGGGKGTQPAETAARLAEALFKGFPGESGITITVK